MLAALTQLGSPNPLVFSSKESPMLSHYLCAGIVASALIAGLVTSPSYAQSSGGASTFGPFETTTVGVTPQAPIVADLTGDGKLDVAFVEKFDLERLLGFRNINIVSS